MRTRRAVEYRDVKYMGSKTSMLSNGLGALIVSRGRRAERVVDLFSGSAAISWFAAERLDRPVLAVDLQQYAVVFAQSVLNRTQPLDADRLCRSWIQRVDRSRRRSKRWRSSRDMNGRLTADDVAAARTTCADRQLGLVWSSYGGYYYSPRQALTLDLLLDALPARAPARTVCHAALLMAASKCAAAPGHTAQPFSPSKTGLQFIHDLWSIDPLRAAEEALRNVCARSAQVRGMARAGDAVKLAKTLCESDLVVIDPPYSAVQYSRFYHVLEVLARQEQFVPDGTGRYPPLEQRPRSDFSLVSAAPAALAQLFANLASTGCTGLLTFPTNACSNGLSGETVTKVAREHFRVRTRRVLGRFSTMGGNNHQRPARHHSDELILTLEPM